MSHQRQHWGASSTISQAQLRKCFRQCKELAAIGETAAEIRVQMGLKGGLGKSGWRQGLLREA